MKLFSGDGGGSDSDTGDLSKIEINEEFARRFEHNKKREDLQRFEELKKQGVISDEDDDSDDSSEDDEDDIGNYSLEDDLKFFDNLIKIRKNDPSLKNANLSDNSDNDNDNEEVNEERKKKRKPKYLKDVNAELALEKGAEFDDEDEDEDMEIRNKTRKKSYVEELEVTRKEFLDAVEGIGDDEGEIFKEKEDKNKDGKDEVEIELDNKLNEYFEVDDEDENEKFLKDFFKKRMWLEEEKDGRKKYDIDVVDEIDVSEDEEEIYKQEDYERGFNFRYQENRDDRVEGHSRKIVDSVRKVDNARKIQRKNKEERMAQAEFDRKEELKRLKNLKKKEMNEKIRKIREIAGFGEKDVCVLDERDLEEDFDPEEYDRKMKKAFDDEFYEAEDVDPKFGSDDEDEDGELKKPNFDEEDELLGLPKGWDGDENRDGFLAIREKTLKKKVKVLEEGEKKKKKRKTSELEEEVIKKELEEYYKLDYEDTIGDLKTRFKYRPVNKNTYGLKAKDILIVDDKELNQLIPLKKMATYREDEFIVPRNKIKEQKQKIKSLLKGESSDGSRHVSKKSKRETGGNVETKKLKSETENEEPKSVSKSRKKSKLEMAGDVEIEKSKSETENDESKSLSKSSKKSKYEVGDVETEKPKSETENEEQKPLSKKQRRKMRNKEFKLGPNRLMAYQKIESKGVKKKKNKA